MKRPTETARTKRHNQFISTTMVIRQHLSHIIEADTTTEHTKHLARSMLGLVTSLQNSLQERVD